MQLHGTLRRLISVASALSALRKSNVAAYLGEGYSHTTKNVFQQYYGDEGFHTATVQQHLINSRIRFNELAQKIDYSISRGRYIHVEDGEPDDYMHNLLSAMRGVAPRKVYLQGGHYKKRLEVAHILWDYLVAKFGIRKPKIFTISAPHEDFAAFDSAEGAGLLSEDRIWQLNQEASEEDYQQAVAKGEASLRNTLWKNRFTTIALKTAPAGLTDVLKDFTENVAIIWTGPIEKRANTNTYEKMFNYFQASAEADQLLHLNIPTVIVSPWLQNTKMTSIIDEKYMEKFQLFVKPIEGFESFGGFKGLARMRPREDAKFSNYFNNLADAFRDRIIEVYEKQKQDFAAQEQEIKEDGTLSEHERELKLEELENVRTRKLALGRRWSYFRRRNSRHETFREFCPMDQTVELVTDPSFKNYVQEVLEVDLKPSGYNDNEVTVEPIHGGGTFIISQWDSAGLEHKIQEAINWMVNGEP